VYRVEEAGASIVYVYLSHAVVGLAVLLLVNVDSRDELSSPIDKHLRTSGGD